MAGQWNLNTVVWSFLTLFALTLPGSPAVAQPRESSEPIGGVTFDPPRRATIRHKSGRVIRGDLIGVSPELVHFRVSSGREFQYALKDIRSIATTDKEFKYASAYDTYRELVEKARGLTGVTIDAAAAVVGTGKPIEFPRPPAPSIPEMVDSPENYEFEEPPEQIADHGGGPRHVPVIPNNQPPQIPPAAAGGAAQPFHETNAFKIGFLVACIGIVGFWWRSKVG